MLWFFVEESIKEDLGKLNLITGLSCHIQLLYNVFDDVLRGHVFGTIEALKECFCPYNAVDEFFRFLPDGAHREALLLDAICTLVALSHSLFDGHARRLISISSCLNQWHIQVEAHLIHVVPGLVVVESVDDEVEPTEEAEAKSVLLNLAHVVRDFDVGVLGTDRLLECL